jgi:D-glycero-D-manno-heptose 1,7-bisphosphate phosphatase
LHIFPYAIDAIRLLRRAGYLAIVVTNQAGVARGVVDEAFIGEAHRHLDERFAAGGTGIDAYYYCPHLVDAPLEQYRRSCDCRKPLPGMVRQAERDFGVDVARSWVIGDKWLDIELGKATGAKTILVRTGYGATEERRPRPGVTPDAICTNLIEAAAWILRQGGDVA